MQAAFSAAYQEGRQLYLAQSEIDNLNRQIVHKEARLKEIEEKMRDAEARLVADEATAAERMSLLDETKSLAQEQGQLEAEVQNMKVDAAVKAEQLKSLRQSVAYTY
jgi:predicted  nucleic acid-binding Zn-ribbon protein